MVRKATGVEKAITGAVMIMLSPIFALEDAYLTVKEHTEALEGKK